MNVSHLLFDLDNTLYPSSAEMDRGITRRMMGCVADFFHVSYEEAESLRAKHIAKFSTTLEWLRSEGLTDTEEYFKAVHPENEADELDEQPALRPLLESIPIPKIILTNAPAEHAERVLEKLRVRDQFDAICDIRACGLLGKPYPQAFRTALETAGGTTADTLFLDDMRKYTDGFQAIGGTAVLIGSRNGEPLDRSAAAVCEAAGQRSGATTTPPQNGGGRPESAVPPQNGRTLRINSVYELPKLLQNIRDL